MRSVLFFLFLVMTLGAAAQVPIQNMPPPPPPPPPPSVYEIPSSFTPNGDNNNDVFLVYGSITAMQLKIYNRWGEEIIVLRKPNDSWDGTYKGKKLESGVFVYSGYIITYDNEKHDVKGNISLIR